MNAILSVKPEYAMKILAGEKQYEYRKTIFRRPVEKVYIYASSPVCMIVGEFHRLCPSGVAQGIVEHHAQRVGSHQGVLQPLFHGQAPRLCHPFERGGGVSRPHQSLSPA